MFLQTPNYRTLQSFPQCFQISKLQYKHTRLSYLFFVDLSTIVVGSVRLISASWTFSLNVLNIVLRNLLEKEAHEKSFLSGILFNPFLNKPCSTSLSKTLWEKEKLLKTSNFSLSTVSSICLESFRPFSTDLKCCLKTISVWKCLKFVLWERIRLLTFYQTTKF